MATSKKFLDQAGVGTLWEQILAKLDTKQDVIDESHKIDASLISVADTAGNFTGETVEAVLAEISTAMETAGAITVAKTVGSEDDSFVTRYVFSQNGSAIENGTIDIGKDMVATSGELVYGSVEDGAFTPNAEGAAYIKMTIANGAPFYISVASLIEYNTFSDSSEIDFTDNNHAITASIVNGSIVKAKLAEGVQASLDLADSALQKADIVQGSANGAIAVDGDDVFVKGLGSAAFTDASAYDAAGAADAIYESIIALTNAEINSAIADATASHNGSEE